MKWFSASRGRRSLGFGAAVGVAAVALFGAGFVTAQALDDGDDPGPAASSQEPGKPEPAMVVPPSKANSSGTAVTVGAPSPTGGGTAQDGREVAIGPGAYGIAPVPACQATLPPVVTGSSIDLARASFDLRLLGGEFTLQSLSLRAERECDENGQAGTGTPVVDTGWVLNDTGVTVSISQRVSPAPSANLVSPMGGQVWVDGYLFTVWVNLDRVLLEGQSEDGRSSTEADKRVEDALRLVLQQLAPSVPDTCYYRQEKGTWADLAAMGIGDPRGAIPAGLIEQWSEFTVFADPAADCNGAELTASAAFSASFGTSSGRSRTSIYLSAYPVGPSKEGNVGYLGDGNASWSNGTYMFNVSGHGDQGPVSRATLEAIALAMDPGFASACFVQTRDLSPGEVASLGLPTPTPPQGLSVVKSGLSVTELPGAACASVPDASAFPQYSLNWVLQGTGVTIEVSVYRHGSGIADGPGFIHPNGMDWTGPDGTRYSVSGYEDDGHSPVDRDTLIAVAKSLDPTLDPDALRDSPPPPSVMPLPAERD